MAYRFAIIGGGLTATSMLCQLVDRLAAMGDAGKPLCQALSIAVYEKEKHFGPGLPHSDQNVLPFHITNMCAQHMSVRAGKPGEFYHWLVENMESLAQLPADICSSVSKKDRHRQCCHYPRALMGEYVKSQFREAVAAAENSGVSVELYPSREVSDLYAGDECLYLIVDPGTGQGDKTRHSANAVLLATGHWFERSARDTYFPSPWPAAALQDAIPQSASVAVIGSSLSAIETALTLSSDGRFLRKSSGELSYQPSHAPRKLTLYSRRGLLPRVRGCPGKRNNIYLTCRQIRDLVEAHPSAITISMILDLLKMELAAAYGTAIDWQEIIQPYNSAVELLRHDIATVKAGNQEEMIWQTILAEVVPLARELYLNLSPSERKRFDKEYTTLFFMHVATQPLQNGEKLMALLEAGMATVVGLGDDYQLTYDEKSGKHLLTYEDAGKIHHNIYDYVVNATGQPRSLQTDPSPLTQNLIRRLMLQPGKGSDMQPEQASRAHSQNLRIDPESHKVVMPQRGDRTSPELPVFAVGPMVRDQIIDTSMAYGLSKSTSQVAEQLIKILAEQTTS